MWLAGGLVHLWARRFNPLELVFFLPFVGVLIAGVSALTAELGASLLSRTDRYARLREHRSYGAERNLALEAGFIGSVGAWTLGMLVYIDRNPPSIAETAAHALELLIAFGAVASILAFAAVAFLVPFALLIRIPILERVGTPFGSFLQLYVMWAKIFVAGCVGGLIVWGAARLFGAT